MLITEDTKVPSLSLKVTLPPLMPSAPVKSLLSPASAREPLPSLFKEPLPERFLIVSFAVLLKFRIPVEPIFVEPPK